jgi:hypothetical protein
MSPIRILKASQSDKIREINPALEACQIRSLGDKAYVLGLPRSTTFTIVRGQHKSSGISARILAQMLASPRLPPLVRAVIEEYARAKAAGDYGTNMRQQRNFSALMQMEYQL